MGQIPSDYDVLATIDEGFALLSVPMDAIDEQDKNARIMSREMQESLSANVRKDGHLESVPLTHLMESGRLELISGHHRLRAARNAGIERVHVLAYLHELPKSTVRAKQLAHNSHEGIDDPATLRELYLQIDDPGDRLSTFLDPQELNVTEAQQPVHIPDVRIAFDWHYVSFAFLPYQFADFEALCARMADRPDTLCIIPEAQFEAFTAVAKRVGITEDIRNVGTTIARMIEITNDALDKQESTDVGS